MIYMLIPLKNRITRCQVSVFSSNGNAVETTVRCGGLTAEFKGCMIPYYCFIAMDLSPLLTV